MGKQLMAKVGGVGLVRASAGEQIAPVSDLPGRSAGEIGVREPRFLDPMMGDDDEDEDEEFDDDAFEDDEDFADDDEEFDDDEDFLEDDDEAGEDEEDRRRDPDAGHFQRGQEQRAGGEDGPGAAIERRRILGTRRRALLQREQAGQRQDHQADEAREFHRAEAWQAGRHRIEEEGSGEREDWILKANDRWHGFGDIASGFNMLDPIKANCNHSWYECRRRICRMGNPSSCPYEIPC